MASNYVCLSCKKPVPADSVRYPPVRSCVQFDRAGGPPVLNVWVSAACPCGAEIGLIRDFRVMPLGSITPDTLRGIACSREVFRPRPISGDKPFGPTISRWTANVIEEKTFKTVFEAEGFTDNSTMYGNLKRMVNEEGYDPSLFVTLRPLSASDLDINVLLQYLKRVLEHPWRDEASPWHLAWRFARIVCALAPGYREDIIKALELANTTYMEDRGVRYNTTDMKKKLKKKGLIK